MADPVLTVAELLRPTFTHIAGGIDSDPVVRRSDRADAQVNGSLALAKVLGKTPREVAQMVLDAANLSDVCSATEIAGPGFINITFANEFLAREIAAAAADSRLGVRNAPTSKKVVIDYSAPNVAKEMHVGHLRSTVIGDALVRMLEFVGHSVVRENHIGDWGTPFGMLIEHLIDLGETEAANELSVGDLDSFYRQARTKFDSNDEFKERARARVVLLQGGDEETLRMWKLLVAESTRYFDRVYQTLGVLLTADDLMGESVYNPLLAPVVDRLRATELLVTSDGAEVVFPEGFVNRENEPLPLIIRKTDGGYNYATSDLACVIDRVERIGAHVVLYVVGAPQAQHLEMVAAVSRMAGWVPEGTELTHVAFGNVLGADRKILKSRSGEVVKLDALLTESVERAAVAVKEKNAELSAAQQAEVARQIGIGAVKYADLSTDRIKDYVFDWERMLAFEGNTSPYLQYAHARICSIFRRAGIDRAVVRTLTPTLDHVAERALALRLLQFDTAVWDTLEKYSPHRLCTYLYELASEFSAFYEHCPVLRADSEAQKMSRLALCDFTARVMEQGLSLLGIESPEQM
ncbi:MAG: arginine--tRNA ligase [Acidimicrobium sp. BACL17 MAG-120924-bin0]|jgi:arginyl-tRNA synthetase|nr:MAG: arginine--tRNA ligase [Acidimicrobium sp. BACL17 MAG-120924-bin0]